MKILILMTFIILSCMGCHTNGDYTNLKNDLYSHSGEGYVNTYSENSQSVSATPSQDAEATPTETVTVEDVTETVEEPKDSVSVSYPSVEDKDGLTLRFRRFDVDFNETVAETDNPAFVAVIQLEYVITSGDDSATTQLLEYNYRETPTLLTDIQPYEFRAYYKGSEYDCKMFLGKKDRIITLKVYGIMTKSENYLSDIRDNLQIILYQNGNPHHILNMTGTFNRG